MLLSPAGSTSTHESDTSETSVVLPTRRTDRTRTIRLQRKQLHDAFGFSVIGGSEHGYSLYVRSVKYGSPAWEAGLALNDEIVRLDGSSLFDVTSSQFAESVNERIKILLTVRTTNVVFVVRRRVALPSVSDSTRPGQQFVRHPPPHRPPSLPAPVIRSDRRSSRLFSGASSIVSIGSTSIAGFADQHSNTSTRVHHRRHQQHGIEQTPQFRSTKIIAHPTKTSHHKKPRPQHHHHKYEEPNIIDSSVKHQPTRHRRSKQQQPHHRRRQHRTESESDLNLMIGYRTMPQHRAASTSYSEKRSGSLLRGKPSPSVHHYYEQMATTHSELAMTSPLPSWRQQNHIMEKIRAELTEKLGQRRGLDE